MANAENNSKKSALFKPNFVGSTDLNLDFDIDENKGQEQLKLLGYHYTKDGKLRNENDEAFKFINQKHYDDLGKSIEEYIYYLLKEHYHFIEENLPYEYSEFYPEDAREVAKIKIFLSKDYDKKSTILLLIPGSGVVCAGQWARSICINDNLASGTMFPFISEALKKDWGIVLFNPNKHHMEITLSSYGNKKMFIAIDQNETPEKHIIYVYDKIVSKLSYKHMFIVAHSYGGICTTTLINSKYDELKDKLLGIGFTDAAVPSRFGIKDETKELYGKIAINWVQSKEPLDTILNSRSPCKEKSAGHIKHEYTSASAFRSVFNYFDELLKNQTMKENNNDKINTNEHEQKESNSINIDNTEKDSCNRDNKDNVIDSNNNNNNNNNDVNINKNEQNDSNNMKENDNNDTKQNTNDDNSQQIHDSPPIDKHLKIDNSIQVDNLIHPQTENPTQLDNSIEKGDPMQIDNSPHTQIDNIADPMQIDDPTQLNDFTQLDDSTQINNSSQTGNCMEIDTPTQTDHL